MTFGQLLRRHRRAVGITQEMLAARSGLSVEAIGALERGTRRAPHQGTIEQLVDALGLADEARDEFERSARPADAGWPGTRGRLPPVLRHFAGRDSQVDEVVDRLRAAGRRGAAPILSIEGMAGTGKTSLAVYAAHRLADAYPDGQIYLELNGFSARPALTELQALTRLLGAVGVQAKAVPSEVAEASALVRSKLAGRRVLLLLDNAADSAQVEHLIPADAGCAVITTSRRKLISLAGAEHLELGLLEPVAALAVLRSVLGSGRVDAEPAEVERLVEQCGRLPLAIGLAAARLAAHPSWRVRDLADRLADEQARLDELAAGDAAGFAAASASGFAELRAAFAVSIDEPADFARLGVVDLETIGLAVGAAILDRPLSAAEAVLEELVDLHILQSAAPERYHLHDLLQVYAREQASITLATDERDAVLTRVIELYRRAALESTRLYAPSSKVLGWADDAWSSPPIGFADAAEAFAWLDAEQPNLVSAINQAAQQGEAAAELVPGLVLGLVPYFISHGPISTWRQLIETALRLTGDSVTRAMLVGDRGITEAQLGLQDESIESFDQAVELFRTAGDRVGEAMAVGNLGRQLSLIGRRELALAPLERSLALHRELGLAAGEAGLLLTLGMHHWMSGERELGLDLVWQSRELNERLGNVRGLAIAEHNIGLLSVELGKIADGVSALITAIHLQGLIDHRAGVADGLADLGSVVAEYGDRADGLAPIREALAIASELGDKLLLAKCQGALAKALG
ncbi:helix-turn-helix domain-containing protein [Kribbella sp. NBC_01245]|uniref:helix-turn-helix domain-containing protein n=1 Tax=Kribbella sp. NBC_01245 TaxID=2903578 RepID=UPI002E2D0B4F|nr:helix-turn-helix domain-containing protein [Kribbella sp. NBC_01245]